MIRVHCIRLPNKRLDSPWDLLILGASTRGYCVGRVVAQTQDEWESSVLGSYSRYSDAKDWLRDVCGMIIKQGRPVP